MATTLYLLNPASVAPDTHLGTNLAKRDGTASGWRPASLSSTIGASATSGTVNTVAGTTNGIELTDTAFPLHWISAPVSADVTISGTITANICSAENSMSANAAINVIIDIIRANTLTTSNSNTIVTLVQSTYATELGTTTAAVNFTTGMTSGGYTSQTLNRGDRLRVRVVATDGGGTMATGFVVTIGYGGNGATNSSFLTFTENFSFESAPAGSQLFLTNEQSGLTAAPALISDFTGSDENPLSEGGNWAKISSAASALQRISNAVGGTAAVACNAYWTPSNFGPDLEAYLTISTISGTFSIAFRVTGEGGASTWDGYVCQHSGGAVAIHVVTNAVAGSALMSTVGITWASGDKMGVRAEGSTLQIWRMASGGSDWNLAATCVDTTHSGSGKIGIQVNNTTVRLDDFYAATDSNLFTQKAWTSRGAGVVSYRSDTDTGWTAPLYTTDWYTPELEAFTLTGMAQANIRALESSASANASLRCELARVDADGTNPTVWASWCCAPTGTDNGELTTSEVARTINVSGDDLAFTDGQRIRIRLYNEDISSAAMANVFNVQRFFNGTSAAASGDSYVTLAQTVTEFSGGGPFVYEKAGFAKESA